MDGLRVAVTGAASGIGRAAVTLLRARGARVIGLDRTVPQDAGADFISFDQGDYTSVDAAAAAVPERLDALLNIAGIPPGTGASPARLLMTNFYGLRRLTGALTDKLVAGGSVTNMSSNAGHGWAINIERVRTFLAADGNDAVAALAEACAIGDLGLGPDAAYPLSKQLVSAWTVQQAMTFRERGHRINAVASAAVTTPILDDFLGNFGDESARRMQAFGSASPEQVAEALVFLASPAAGWINGAVMPVDGGAAAASLAREYGL